MEDTIRILGDTTTESPKKRYSISTTVLKSSVYVALVRCSPQATNTATSPRDVSDIIHSSRSTLAARLLIQSRPGISLLSDKLAQDSSSTIQHACTFRVQSLQLEDHRFPEDSVHLLG